MLPSDMVISTEFDDENFSASEEMEEASESPLEMVNFIETQETMVADLQEAINIFNLNYKSVECSAPLQRLLEKESVAARLKSPSQKDLAKTMLDGLRQDAKPYLKAAHKFHCYRLFGRHLDADSDCGRLSIEEFIILLAQSSHRSIHGTNLARSLLKDEPFITRMLDIGLESIAGRILPHTSHELQRMLFKIFKPKLNRPQLEAWVKLSVNSNVSIHVFRKLLELCRQNFDAAEYPLLIRDLTMKVSRLEIKQSFGSDWLCGTYCRFMRVLIETTEPGTMWQMEAGGGILQKNFWLIALFSNEIFPFKARPMHAAIPLKVLEEIDFVATATRFHREKFQDDDYKNRCLKIANLMLAALASVQSKMPRPLLVLINLAFRGFYRSLDIFLSASLNGAQLSSSRFHSFINGLARSTQTLDILAIAQVLKYSDLTGYTPPPSLPQAITAVIEMRRSIEHVCWPCQSGNDPVISVAFFIPLLMPLLKEHEVEHLLRSYLLFQFGIPLDQSQIIETADDEMTVDEFKHVLNFIVNQFCLRKKQRAAIVIVSDDYKFDPKFAGILETPMEQVPATSNLKINQ